MDAQEREHPVHAGSIPGKGPSVQDVLVPAHSV